MSNARPNDKKKDTIRPLDSWSTDAPTEDGWYWAVDISGCIDMINLDRGAPYRLLTAYDVSDFTHWLGPLPKPEPPNAECAHEWIDATNEVVSGAELCLKCNAARARPEPSGGV